MSAWFAVGEFVGLGIKIAFPKISIQTQQIAHACGMLFAALETLGVWPHKRSLKRCLSHANHLHRSGFINDAEWELMRAECLRAHQR